MKCQRIVACAVLLSVPLTARTAADQKTPDSVLIKVLGEELDHSMNNLAMPDGTKPYFMAYTITDQQKVSIGAELGALTDDEASQDPRWVHGV